MPAPTPNADPADPAPAGPPTPQVRPSARLLVVDDEPLQGQELVAVLQRLGYPLVRVLEPADDAGWREVLRAERPDLILLDLDLGGGPAAAALLAARQADPRLRWVPVIALQSVDAAPQRLAALRAGVGDIVLRPVDPEELALRVALHLNARLETLQLASTDACTGLPHRAWLLTRLDEALRDARRHGHQGALLQLALLQGRRLTDSLGLSARDDLARMIGQRLRAGVRATDVVGVHGGHDVPVQIACSDADEFSVLLPRISRPEEAARVAQRLVQTLGAPLTVGGQAVEPAFRIGIAIFPDDGPDAACVLERAMLAAHQQEEALDTQPVRFVATSLDGRHSARLRAERELRRALTRDELRLHYQPKVDVATGRIDGAEALVRWQHPERGLLSPVHFVPLAEECGLIGSLGLWVLREAVRQTAVWRRQGLPPLVMSVNVSCQQLRMPSLVAQVQQCLQAESLEAGWLCLELTESAILDDGPATRHVLTRLKQLGVQLALDDFGTGYSSLSYLRSVPLDELKIDRSFIEECRSAWSSAAIITDAMVVMAHALGLRVVAEGIETMEQLDFLRRNGCDQVQGYLLSRPVCAQDFEALLRNSPSGHADDSPAPAWHDTVLAPAVG